MFTVNDEYLFAEEQELEDEEEQEVESTNVNEINDSQSDDDTTMTLRNIWRLNIKFL